MIDTNGFFVLTENTHPVPDFKIRETGIETSSFLCPNKKTQPSFMHQYHTGIDIGVSQFHPANVPLHDIPVRPYKKIS